MLEVHFTEAQEYLRCARKWYNGNYLQLEPLEKGQALQFGGAFHKLKEAYLKGPDTDDGVVLAEVQDSDLLLKLFRVWREWYEKQDYVHYQVEQPLSIPMTFASQEITFTVTPDGMFTGPNGELWIDETKTVGSFDEERLHLDLQGRVQMLVAKQLGYDVAGVKYTQVRKSNPDTARADILHEYEVRFPEGALRDAAVTIDYALSHIVDYRDALSVGALDIERTLLRNPNPISFMDCACWFSKACIASFMGREEEALRDLYKVREPR